MLPIIYFLKYLVRSGIRTHAYSCLRPERSALDHSDHANSYLFLHIECRILILLEKSHYSHVAYYIVPKIFGQKRDSNPRLQL